MILVPSNSGKDMRIHFELLVTLFRRKQLILVHIEDNVFNLYWSKEVGSTETKIVNNSQQPGNDKSRAVRS